MGAEGLRWSLREMDAMVDKDVVRAAAPYKPDDLWPVGDPALGPVRVAMSRRGHARGVQRSSRPSAPRGRSRVGLVPGERKRPAGCAITLMDLTLNLAAAPKIYCTVCSTSPSSKSACTTTALEPPSPSNCPPTTSLPSRKQPRQSAPAHQGKQEPPVSTGTHDM